jgi:small-conductance mechanosensitive channel
MKDKFNLFFRQITLIAILLAPFFSFSQAKQTGIVIDSSMVVKPEAIPVLKIIQKIEETNEAIRLSDKKILPSSSIIQIDSLLPGYIQLVKKRKKRTDNFIKSNPNRQKINILIREWNAEHYNLNNWESTVNDSEKRNLRLIEVISFQEQTWELTYQHAIEEKVPPEISTSIKIILNKVKKSKKSYVDASNKLLRLESKINKQKTVINKAIENLNALKYSETYDLFYLRHPPLWKTSLKTVSNKIKKDKIESVSENISRIFSFIEISESDIYLYVIVVALLISLFLLLKRSYVKFPFNEEDGDLQNAKDIVLNHSLASIIFLSLVFAKLFFYNAPTLFGDSLILLILIASIPLLQPYMYNRFKKITYFVVLFFILDTAKTYVWFSSVQYRIYLLVEAFIVIILLFRFTYPYIKTRKMKIGKFGLLLIHAVPLIYLLSIISIVSNVLGYTNLTDLTLKINIQSSIITIIFYIILMIFGGVSTGLIHRHFSKRESVDPDQKFAIEKKSLEVLRVFAFVFWILFFLRGVDLLTPLTDYFTDIFTEPYNMGTITFTVGAILTFILILTVSYLITRFISFLFDDGGVSLKFLNVPKGIPAAISLVIRYFIIIFGIVLALSSLGIDLSKFNLMAGALGLGIGFGLQTIVSNFISGLILVFERPILPGDTVEVNNLLGTVNRIGVRSSTISTFDGAEVVVPNNNLIANDLINWTLSNNIRRVEILIGTTYGSDPNEILKILSEVANEYEDVLKDPPPSALLNEFGDSSLNFRLLFWVPYEIGLRAKSDVAINVYNRFKELGVEIPFPQQDIHIKDLPKQIQDTRILPKPTKTSEASASKKGNAKKNKEPLKEGSSSEEDTEQS